jgi:LmbE family N-acetylglucosaminyl deacetylase
VTQPTHDRDSTPAAGYTLVAFHAHPDDEALYTGGTLARCSAEGHRVVVVTATAGERGLTGRPASGGSGGLGVTRLAELDDAARALGVDRVVTLGYGDSGMDPAQPPPPGSLCAADVEEVARRLAEVLVEERADVLTTYDAAGGYGHRDHVRVHEAGARAAALAGTPVVLEATVAREPIRRGLRLLNLVGIRPGGMTSADLAFSYRSRREITHEIDVRAWVPAKRRALAAHASQTSGGADVRTVALLSRLPLPLARRVLGREWFVETGKPPAARPSGDVFSSLR